jgi:hypothetical protein
MLVNEHRPGDNLQLKELWWDEHGIIGDFVRFGTTGIHQRAIPAELQIDLTSPFIVSATTNKSHRQAGQIIANRSVAKYMQEMLHKGSNPNELSEVEHTPPSQQIIDFGK